MTMKIIKNIPSGTEEDKLFVPLFVESSSEASFAKCQKLNNILTHFKADDLSSEEYDCHYRINKISKNVNIYILMYNTSI